MYQAGNSAFPPETVNPQPESSNKDSTMHPVIQDIKETLHDVKENVKEVLQRDHHNGQDCAKKPQDGKTNPME